MKKENIKKPKILIIEDDKFLGGILKKEFEEAGFGLTIFTNAENNIIEKVIEENPDVILSNVIMPEIIGFEIIRLLKADKRTKDIPFIFLTTLGQKEDIEKGMKLGATDYLVKSLYTPKEIVEKIKIFFENQKNGEKWTG